MQRPPDSDSFYVEFFTKNPTWSTAYPNREEVRRAAKILPLLTEVARERRKSGVDAPLRILDLGCGRGWLTYMADAYGECLGIDPVGGVIEFARTLFPQLEFEVGTAGELVDGGRDGEFDVVISSEVIEHVSREDRDDFVGFVRSLLRGKGAVILSSDRGELYDRWAARAGSHQPVEEWMTEREIRNLFSRHGFLVDRHERVFYEHGQLSLLHKVAASRRVSDALARVRQRWLLEGLRFVVAECQVWLFRLP